MLSKKLPNKVYLSQRVNLNVKMEDNRPPISRLPLDNGQVTQLINHHGRIEGDRSDRLSTNLGIETISFIPCYYDIQFLEKEFLTVFKYKQHPFTSQIEKMMGVL
jgi:hypothetical protein